MRLPSIPTILKTALAFSNSTIYRASPTFAQLRTQLSRSPVALRASMPIPFLGALFGTSSTMADNTKYPVSKTEGEWQAQLSPEQFRIIREKGTEYPGSGKYYKHQADKGVYGCAACDAPLYMADDKFQSGCGWPAFFRTVPGAVKEHEDNTLGMRRTEILCSNCGGHLGHIFRGEPSAPGGIRHCVNSVSIKFSEDDSAVDKSTLGDRKKPQSL